MSETTQTRDASDRAEVVAKVPILAQMTSLKAVLIAIHSLTLVLGVVLLVGGIVTNIQHLAFHEAWHASYGIYNGSVLCITIGVIILALSILGLIGAARENDCILLVFCVLLTLVVVTELCLVTALFTLAHQDKLGNVVGETMQNSLMHFEKPGYEGVTKAWNLIQTELTCCGVKEPRDWFNFSDGHFQPPFLPESCCAAVQLGQKCRIDNQAFGPYEQGCLSGLAVAVSRNAGVIATIVAVVTFFQIGVIVITSQLIRKSNQPKTCPPFY